MKKSIIKKYQIYSTIFAYIFGSLLHFIYEWSNKNKIVAIFSSVNESTFEHLKLLFFPILVTIIFGQIYIKKYASNLLCAKTIGILCSIIFMVLFYYTYPLIVGNNITIIDILSFYISVTVGEFVAYLYMVNKVKCNNKLAIIVLSICVICFSIFTFSPPKNILFKDPVSQTYGIN